LRTFHHGRNVWPALATLSISNQASPLHAALLANLSACLASSCLAAASEIWPFPIGIERGLTPSAPPTEPYVRSYRIRLPPGLPVWAERGWASPCSRGLEAGACDRRLDPLGGSGVRRCSAVPHFIPKLERQHQLNAQANRSLALHSRSLVSRLRPLRSATVSRCLDATMGRSDFSTGIRVLASRLSRVASGEPSSPDPLRSPSVTSRSLPIMPTAPTVQDLVLGFRSAPHRRPPARPSPVRLRFGLIFASGPSPSASRPAAAFGYRGILRRTSTPGKDFNLLDRNAARHTERGRPRPRGGWW